MLKSKMKPAMPGRKRLNSLIKEECVFKQSVKVDMKDEFAKNTEVVGS